MRWPYTVEQVSEKIESGIRSGGESVQHTEILSIMISDIRKGYKEIEDPYGYLVSVPSQGGIH